VTSTEPAFPELESRVLTLFGAGDFDAALEATRSAARRFPDRLAYTAFWAASIYGAKGEPAKALHALTDAVGRSEVWWDGVMLKEDTDLQVLRAVSGFEDLVAECDRRGARAKAEAQVEAIVLEPVAARFESAVLVALHGRTGNLTDSAEAWRAAQDEGITTIVLQSGQMIAHEMYCWDDLAIATDDVRSGVRRVLGDEPTHVDVVLAGFSQGGGVAARLALGGDALAASGFVAVAPSFHRAGVSPEDIVPLLQGALAARVAGWLVVGGDDERYRPRAELVAQEMDKAGVPYSLTVNEGVGHEFPPSFDRSLAWMLPMLLGRT
jgi:dienelactone hydrolase